MRASNDALKLSASSSLAPLATSASRKLRVGEAAEIRVQPTRIVYTDSVRDIRGALSGVPEEHDTVGNAGDELRRLRGKPWSDPTALA